MKNKSVVMATCDLNIFGQNEISNIRMTSMLLVMVKLYSLNTGVLPITVFVAGGY